MMYGFTERVRSALAAAREEAIRLSHEHVRAEHILLGLLHETEGGAATVLAKLSVDVDLMKTRAEESMAEGEIEIVLGQMPYSSDGKDVLKYAMREVRDLGASEVGTEHLLLGVLNIPTGVVTQILTPFDVSLEVARAEVEALSK